MTDEHCQRNPKLSEKNYKNFQWNQPLYLHGLNVNFGVGFRDHEETFRDLGSGFVVKRLCN